MGTGGSGFSVELLSLPPDGAYEKSPAQPARDLQYRRLHGRQPVWDRGNEARRISPRNRIDQEAHRAMGALTVRLPDSLHEKVRDLAEEEGISMSS